MARSSNQSLGVDIIELWFIKPCSKYFVHSEFHFSLFFSSWIIDYKFICLNEMVSWMIVLVNSLIQLYIEREYYINYLINQLKIDSNLLLLLNKL